ncbi:hypothetical protein ACFW35_13350 [Fictibacillus sp. NPDC058756]|uniref:hypothetical protein n=1 Tax=Fictibacillus sp. NPDC058756 TaxID=3346625 RepID=UPI003679D806
MTGRNIPCHKKQNNSYLYMFPMKIISSFNKNEVYIHNLCSFPHLEKAYDDLNLKYIDFYAKDIALFYLEMNKGNNKCIENYVYALKIIGQMFSGFDIFSRDEISSDFWKKLLIYDFPKLSKGTELNNLSNFFNIFKEFVLWLDKKYGWENYKYVNFFLNNYHFPIRNCQHIQLIFNKKNNLIFLDEYAEKSSYFVVKKINSNSIFCYDTYDSRVYKIFIPEELFKKNLVVFGTVFKGTIKSINQINWGFCNLEFVFPPQALKFVVKSN